LLIRADAQSFDHLAPGYRIDILGGERGIGLTCDSPQS
jgi:hypothetical protein